MGGATAGTLVVGSDGGHSNFHCSAGSESMGLAEEIGEEALAALTAEYSAKKRLNLAGEAFSKLTSAGLAELPALFPDTEAIFTVANNSGVFAAPLGYEQVWHQARGAQSLWVWKPRPPPGHVTLGFVSTTSAGQPSTDLMRCVAESHAIPAAVGSQTWNDSGTGGTDGAFWSLPSGHGVCAGGTHAKPSDDGVFTMRVGADDRDETAGRMVQQMSQVYNDSGSGGSADVSIWRPDLPSGSVLLGDHVKLGHGAPSDAILVGRTSSSSKIDFTALEQQMPSLRMTRLGTEISAETYDNLVQQCVLRGTCCTSKSTNFKLFWICLTLVICLGAGTRRRSGWISQAWRSPS